MTLSPGESWGSVGRFPANAPIVSTDAQLATLAGRLHHEGTTGVVGLADGDLCVSLGGRGDVASRRGEEVPLLPVDIGCARCDDDPLEHFFAAHLVARGRWWGGPCAAVMNAERLGPWLVAPRAHPGDGRLDVVEGRLAIRERVLARGRARTGAHVPHPQLSQRRVQSLTLDFAQSRQIHLDGAFVGRHRRVQIELLSNAVLVAV